MPEREEEFAVDGGHYCPLGVELTEGVTGEVIPLVPQELRFIEKFSRIVS